MNEDLLQEIENIHKEISDEKTNIKLVLFEFIIGNQINLSHGKGFIYNIEEKTIKIKRGRLDKKSSKWILTCSINGGIDWTDVSDWSADIVILFLDNIDDFLLEYKQFSLQLLSHLREKNIEIQEKWGNEDRGLDKEG